MKKVKFIVFFALILILSIFVFFREKFSFYPKSAEIGVETTLGSDKILNIQVPEKTKFKNGDSEDKESYSIKTTEKNFTFLLTANKSVLVTLLLKNPNTFHVVQYDFLHINNQKALTIPQQINPEGSYNYTFIVKPNKEYVIDLQWETL